MSSPLGHVDRGPREAQNTDVAVAKERAVMVHTFICVFR